jgi:hypothetical protein
LRLGLNEVSRKGKILLYCFEGAYYNGAILKVTKILGTRIVKAIAIGNN